MTPSGGVQKNRRTTTPYPLLKIQARTKFCLSCKFCQSYRWHNLTTVVRFLAPLVYILHLWYSHKTIYWKNVIEVHIYSHIAKTWTGNFYSNYQIYVVEDYFAHCDIAYSPCTVYETFSICTRTISYNRQQIKPKTKIFTDYRNAMYSSRIKMQFFPNSIT